MTLSDQEVRDGARASAYLGNALLVTARQADASLLSTAFWDNFPMFEDADIRQACAAVAEYLRWQEDAGADVVTDASVEYTHLFIGPPRPAACPWETMYRGQGGEVGFGKPTAEMRALLRAAGLAVHNENRQYEDHMGIELLYLSVLLDRLNAGGSEGAESADSANSAGRDEAAASTGNAGDIESDEGAATPAITAADVKGYLADHPLDWADAFRAAVAQDRPDGFYVRLLDVVCAFLKVLDRLLA